MKRKQGKGNTNFSGRRPWIAVLLMAAFFSIFVQGAGAVEEETETEMVLEETEVMEIQETEQTEETEQIIESVMNTQGDDLLAQEEQWMPEEFTEPQAAPGGDAKAIQEALETGAEIVLTFSRNMEFEETVRITGEKMVTLLPEEGKQIVMSRAAGFDGEMFLVEEGGTLCLGQPGEELEGNAGMLIIDGALEDGGDNVVISGRGGLITYENVMVVNGDTEVPVDLSGGVITMLDSRNIYSGAPVIPAMEVSLEGEILIPGRDYEIICSNNINAGAAWAVISGVGKYTGTISTEFFIEPAEVLYEVADQQILSGGEIQSIQVAKEAIGTGGEGVTGTLLWSLSPDTPAQETNMVLSGMEGETMELYWTFYPDSGNYNPARGSTQVTFIMPEMPDMESFDSEGIWDQVGELVDGDSSRGTTWEENEIPPEQPAKDPEEVNETTQDRGITTGTGGSSGTSATAGRSGTGFTVSARKGASPQTGDGSAWKLWTWAMIIALTFLLMGVSRKRGQFFMRESKGNNDQ